MDEVSDNVKQVYVWEREHVYELIELLEARPELWNYSSSEYRNRNLKRKSIEFIATTLNVTIDAVHKKIHNLRCQLNSELRKIKNKKRVFGADENFVSKWEFFEALKFMNFNANSSELCSVGSIDIDPNIKGEEEEDDSQHTPYALEEDKESEDELNNKRRRKNRSVVDRVVRVTPQNKTHSEPYLSHSHRVEEAYICKNPYHRDDCSTYGEHVANELRKLGSRAQTIVKHMINNTLFEAAMGKYDVEIEPRHVGTSPHDFH